MDKQITLSAFSDELANVRTKKKEFLAQIDRIVPWGEWGTEIKLCCYKGERGNKPCDLERMLGIYMLQNLYNLPNMGTVEDNLTKPRAALAPGFVFVISGTCQFSLL